MINIRKATSEDNDIIWDIIQPIIRKGDTYAFAPDSTKQEMLHFWCGPKNFTYVALLNDVIVGTFTMKDNQPGLGSHIANAAYMVLPQYAGLGIGRKMGEYSLRVAKKLGYKGMQFNMVVSNNISAIKLWGRLGFEIIGEIPEAFKINDKGYVSVYIMHRML